MSKYANTNPLEKLHDGEPFFFVRAQDKFAPAVIKAYATLLSFEGDKSIQREIHVLREEFISWQKANPDKVKHPD